MRNGTIDRDDPAVILELLKLDAVVGVPGFFDRGGRLTSVGITCALCHSDVDDSFAEEIGRRLDGRAARDLEVGKVIALAPSVAPFAELLGSDENALRRVLEPWGQDASTPRCCSTARRRNPTASPPRR